MYKRQGETIVAEGTAADSFYVIVEGTCVVKKRTLVTAVDGGQEVGRLEKFDHFGEASLLRVFDEGGGGGGAETHHLRNATVAAHGAGGVQVLSLSAGMLRGLVEDGTIQRDEILRGVDEARKSREARTRWALARRNVAAAANSRSLFAVE